MNWGRGQNEGYTIVETLIFLAVSGAMVVAVMATIGGQQRKTEFQTSVRDFQTKLQDVANDVSTGYFNTPDVSGVNCKSLLQKVNFDSGNSDVPGCVLLGRVIQFKPGGLYNIYTIVGKKVNNLGEDTASIVEASPIALSKESTGYGNVPESVETFSIQAGEIEKVSFGPGTLIGSVAFISGFQDRAPKGLSAGTYAVNVIPVLTSAISDNDRDAVGKINVTTPNLLTSNPEGGIKICIKSLGTDQYAVVTLGGNNSGALTVNATISQGTACPVTL